MRKRGLLLCVLCVCWAVAMAAGPVPVEEVNPFILFTPVPEEVRKRVEDERAKIVSGEWDVFTGPIKDQKGEVRVKEGTTMSDPDIWSMNWFVEGVSGEIPQ